MNLITLTENYGNFLYKLFIKVYPENYVPTNFWQPGNLQKVASINESTVNMQKPAFENNGQNKVRISIHQYYSVQKCLKKKKKLWKSKMKHLCSM